MKSLTVYLISCHFIEIIDFWKCLPNFLFRNWTLSLLLKKSKVGSVISFPVWFHLILFLPLINDIINQFPLLIALILITELKGMFIYKYMVFSCALFFPRNLVQNSEQIDLHVHGEKFNSLYAFELMIHFLAEESFLNMHSDSLLNVTRGVWIV